MRQIIIYTGEQEGSHMIMRRDNPFGHAVVSDRRELDGGTLRAIIRLSGLSADEFLRLRWNCENYEIQHSGASEPKLPLGYGTGASFCKSGISYHSS